MSARSNFESVRLSGDGLSLHVVGKSLDALDDAKSADALVEVYASVVKRPADDDRVPKHSEKQGKVGTNAIPGDWELDITITSGEFKAGDHVLLAGAALRADPDVWIDSIAILPPVGG